jgi:hypothetical protein
MNNTTETKEQAEARLNAEAEARVRTPEYQKRLARKRKAARRWHLTHEA